MILAACPSFVFAEIKPIPSLTAVKDHVDYLLEQGVKSKDIVVVWDCHGVITAQGTPQKNVEATLNPETLDVLKHLSAEKIPQIIATASRDPYEVQKDLARLQVTPYFEAPASRKERLEQQLHCWQEILKQAKASSGKKHNKSRKIKHASNIVKELQTELSTLAKHQKRQLFYGQNNTNVESGNLEVVALGKNKSVVLEGHKIGRITALREHEKFPSPYFRKKAFGAEWCFPGNNFQHIIFVDDDKYNLGMFERDFKETIHYSSEEDMKKLTLYHFSPPAPKAKLKPGHMTPFHSNSDSEDNGDDFF